MHKGKERYRRLAALNFLYFGGIVGLIGDSLTPTPWTVNRGPPDRIPFPRLML